MIGIPAKRETGLFADNGQPVNRTMSERQRRSISGHSANAIVFETGHHNFDYRGETLGNLIPDSNPPRYNGTDIMHARYGHNNAVPYCLELPNGQIIDAALHRGVAALANHGPMNGVHGIVTNAEFRVHPTTNRAWIQAIHPIRNGDQI